MNSHIARKTLGARLFETHDHPTNGGIIERLSASSEVMGWKCSICSPLFEPLEVSYTSKMDVGANLD